MQLKPYQEIVGNLRYIHHENELLTVVFQSEYKIEIPYKKDIFDKLNGLIGERIGILNSENDKYKIRKVRRKTLP